MRIQKAGIDDTKNMMACWPPLHQCRSQKRVFHPENFPVKKNGKGILNVESLLERFHVSIPIFIEADMAMGDLTAIPTKSQNYNIWAIKFFDRRFKTAFDSALFALIGRDYSVTPSLNMAIWRAFRRSFFVRI